MCARSILRFPGLFQAIRDEVGRDFPVIIKINSEDFMEPGFSVDEMLQVCGMLEAAGISAEVIDLATLYPLDTRTVLESAAKTRRLVTVEEGPLTGGIGAGGVEDGQCAVCAQAVNRMAIIERTGRRILFTDRLVTIWEAPFF